MAVFRAVFVRTAEPLDEEQCEGLTDAGRDLRLRLVHAMHRDQRGLVRVHVIVEARSESAGSFDTEAVERRVIGTDGLHGQWRFDFGKSDFIVEQ